MRNKKLLAKTENDKVSSVLITVITVNLMLMINSDDYKFAWFVSALIIFMVYLKWLYVLLSKVNNPRKLSALEQIVVMMNKLIFGAFLVIKFAKLFELPDYTDALLIGLLIVSLLCFSLSKPCYTDNRIFAYNRIFACFTNQEEK